MLKSAQPDKRDLLRTAILYALRGYSMTPSGKEEVGEDLKALFEPLHAAQQDLVTKDIAPDTNRWRIRGGRKSGQNISRENFLKELGFE